MGDGMADASGSMKTTRRPFVVPEPALVWMVFVGIALRVAWLFQPIRYDEAITFLGTVRGGVHEIVTSYGAPNNHVFHSLLVWATTHLSSDPWAIRLPALAAGTLVPVAAYFVGLRLHGRTAALIGAAFVATSVHLIEYATNARGYSIVTLLALVQILLADRLVRTARHRDLAAFAVVTALGLFTVPTMLYPTLATLAWALLAAGVNHHETPWRTLARRAPLYAALGGLLTLACYLPILRQPQGFERLTSNRWVAPLATFADWRAAIAPVGQEMIGEWSLGLTSVGAAIVAAGAIVTTFFAIRRGHARAAWVPVAIVVVAAVLVGQRVAPFARVFCFALPMVLLAGAAGLAEGLRRLRVERLAPWFSVALCTALAVYVAIARLPDRAGEADKFPDAAPVVSFLSTQATAGETVIYGVVPSGPIQYEYFRSNRATPGYRAGAPRLWVVTRGDEPVGRVLRSRSNRLPPDAFGPPKLVWQHGLARIYEVLPNDGRTPAQARRRTGSE